MQVCKHSGVLVNSVELAGRVQILAKAVFVHFMLIHSRRDMNLSHLPLKYEKNSSFKIFSLDWYPV